MKTLKRLGAGILAFGLIGAGTVLVAPAASAHANSVKGVATCAENGTYTVTWTITNDYADTEDVTEVSHVGGTAVTGLPVVIGPKGSATATTTGIVGTATEAKLTVKGVWRLDGHVHTKTGTVQLGGVCTPPDKPEPTGTLVGECADNGSFVVNGTFDADGAEDAVFRLNVGEGAQLIPLTGSPFQETITASAGTTVKLQVKVGDGFFKRLGDEVTVTDCEQPPAPSGTLVGDCQDDGSFVVNGTFDDDEAQGAAFSLALSNGTTIPLDASPFQVDITAPAGTTVTLQVKVGDGPLTPLGESVTVEDCEQPPVVTPPSGSFTTECTATAAQADVGTLTPGTATGTFRLTGPNGFSQPVTSGQQNVTVPVSATITLEFVPAQGAATVLDTENSPAACPPPVVTPPSGSFTTECTETGAQADVGTLTPGSAPGTFRLTGPNGFSQPVTSGQQNVTVPVSVTITLEFVPTLGAATVLDTKSSPAACLTPSVAPVRGLGLVKAVSPTTTVSFGDTLTYTLTVSATGNAPQTAVTVTDSVPSGTTYEAGTATCDGTCTTGFSGGVVTWGLGGMAAGSTRTVSFEVTIDTPAADADGGFPAVTILNAGAVQSAEVPSTPSNEVATPVTAVLGTQTGSDDSDDTDDTEEDVDAAPTSTGTAVLAATGAGVPVGGLVGIAGLFILVGLALVSAGRPVVQRTKG